MHRCGQHKIIWICDSWCYFDGERANRNKTQKTRQVGSRWCNCFIYFKPKICYPSDATNWENDLHTSRLLFREEHELPSNLLKWIVKSFQSLTRLFSTWFSFVTLCYSSISWHVRRITSVLQKDMNTKRWKIWESDLKLIEDKDRCSHRST